MNLHLSGGGGLSAYNVIMEEENSSENSENNEPPIQAAQKVMGEPTPEEKAKEESGLKKIRTCISEYRKLQTESKKQIKQKSYEDALYTLEQAKEKLNEIKKIAHEIKYPSVKYIRGVLRSLMLVNTYDIVVSSGRLKGTQDIVRDLKQDISEDNEQIRKYLDSLPPEGRAQASKNVERYRKDMIKDFRIGYQVDIGTRIAGDVLVTHGLHKLSKSLKDIHGSIDKFINKKIIKLSRTQRKVRRLILQLK